MGEGTTEWTRRAALGLLPALGLAGCASRRGSDAPLSLWAMSWEGDYSPHLMPAFTAATGIDVDVQSLPTTASHEKLLTAFAGGALPDVLMLFNGWVQEFATIGAIATVPSPALVADMFPGVLASTQVGGRDYAVPWSVAPQVQFYRRDILAAAGYDTPPEDWDGWRRMARAIKRRRPDDYVFLMLLNWPTALITMLSQAGSTMLRDRDTRGNFQTPEARAAFAYYASLYADGYAPMALSTEIQDPVAAFATGYCAIWPSGPTTLKDFARRADIIPRDRWATARLAGPHGIGPVSGLSSSLCVSTQTKRPREAWALVRHLTSAPSELDYQRLIGNLPARMGAWRSPQLADPVLRPFAAQMWQPASAPRVIEWERIQAEIQLAAERVVRGVQTLDAALAALDARVDRLLAKRRALVEAGTIL
ncbi:extracellular solute-binding protein [Sphingomonas ginsenosidivorax]|uniref:Extracellular solute-binding protein n=1 Tax=Sphingomonas ginsenosidivorax TaxID=862135 RepID=A0A5C6UC99_9SPHN|nr:extracellular solute-binding protein [Sphingomonas ginsenosidivorax]TXC70332.1 extracellular solute-binding protein [Sphingomonas ginsenosidivorax]